MRTIASILREVNAKAPKCPRCGGSTGTVRMAVERGKTSRPESRKAAGLCTCGPDPLKGVHADRAVDEV